MKNLDKPGRHITGVSDRNPANEQLELIKVFPDVKTIGAALLSSRRQLSKTQVEEFSKISWEEAQATR